MALLAVGAGAVFVLIVLPQMAKDVGEHESAGYVYDATLGLARRTADGLSYTVNCSMATCRLDALADDVHSRRLFPDCARATAYCVSNGLRTIPSVALIEAKLKQFDDGLVVAVEQAADAGLPTRGILPKSAALERLLARLLPQRPASDAALVHVGAALRLHGETPALPADLAGPVDDALALFRTDEVRSRPIGVWAASESLQRLFQTDRFLAMGVDGPAAKLLADTVAGDPALAATVAFHRTLAGKLTGQPRSDRYSLLPLVNSPETVLLERLWREGRLTGADNTMRLVLGAVRDGSLPLAPTANSGWYDYQWHAWEPLLLWDRAREAGKLQLTSAYRRRLELAFAAALTGGRETHIKRLPVITLGMRMAEPRRVEIAPEFAAEPALTVYLRRARAYRFIHAALEELLGAATLPVEVTDGLARQTRLCYGLHERLCREVGLPARSDDGELAVEARAAAEQELDRWLAAWPTDPALAADVRVAAPILQTAPGGPVRYWAALGVKLQPVEYRFNHPPLVSGPCEPVFVPRTNYLATVVFGEFVRVAATPLTRAEFRQLCDAHSEEAGLRRALGVAALPGVEHDWPTWLKRAGGAVLAVGLLVVLWRYRRARRWAVIVVAGLLVAVALRWWLSPTWRAQFIVRHVMPINMPVAMICEGRLRDWLAHPDALVPLLEDADPQIRYYAARLLNYAEKNPSPNLRDTLRRAARDPDEMVAGTALSLLGHFPDEETVTFLLDEVARRREPFLRCDAALRALATIRNARVLPVLLALVDDSRTELRRSAIHALQKFDTPAVTATQERLLQSSDQYLRGMAFHGLRQQTNAIAVSLKCEALRHPQVSFPEARRYLVEGWLAGPAAAEGYRVLRAKAVTPAEQEFAVASLALAELGLYPVQQWDLDQFMKAIQEAAQTATLAAVVDADNREQLRTFIVGFLSRDVEPPAGWELGNWKLRFLCELGHKTFRFPDGQVWDCVKQRLVRPQ